LPSAGAVAPLSPLERAGADPVHRSPYRFPRKAHASLTTQGKPGPPVAIGLPAAFEYPGNGPLPRFVLACACISETMIPIGAFRHAQASKEPFQAIASPQRTGQPGLSFPRGPSFAEASAFFERRPSSARRTSFSNLRLSQYSRKFSSGTSFAGGVGEGAGGDSGTPLRGQGTPLRDCVPMSFPSFRYLAVHLNAWALSAPPRQPPGHRTLPRQDTQRQHAPSLQQYSGANP